ncbi:MAG: hypothetical protein UX04_C0006G0042 [Microgenomates group bacterium GW2011_GWF2_45_18]|nr:MAG: hypothetical protein UW18_C0006G0043 [Microgenomates group bacterium GW2011_GWF1_44_10]KKU01507.1 MAG: hypothetical protein UX04_C0006G0042 [Microgenomates group bacterium GW2011_GWF2_45_18]OGJ40562.1 MAG: hypothetical protein A2378_01735 [Candidatus Pacebacteria bacterium RIFOXYB1_FULL_44_10]HAU99415.1 hypothetical protein [Candidatus Paceibacterota bacterium]HAX01579.1 hypothetical protein [Candidatus Paceibacterota bacterium]
MIDVETHGEVQYDLSLAVFVQEFNRHSDTNIAHVSAFPNYDWHDYSNLVSEMVGLVSELQKSNPQLTGMALFESLWEKIKGARFNGKKSHLLLSLFHRGYFTDDTENNDAAPTGLFKEVWDSTNGNAVNPIFKKNAEELPVNIRMRHIIMEALISDFTYYSVQNDSEKATWCQKILKGLNEVSEVKPRTSR